jgi:hypothetical protein
VRARRKYYVPINKKSNDLSVASSPFRRRAGYPRNRSSPGSASSPKEALLDEDANAIAPSTYDPRPASQQQDRFRNLTTFFVGRTTAPVIVRRMTWL